MTALENVLKFQMSLVVKLSGAKETEVVTLILNQLPEVTEELDIHVGLQEDLLEPEDEAVRADGEVVDHQVDPLSSSSQKHS
jgi:hypothetical protein